jgi:hypothetical protein
LIGWIYLVSPDNVLNQFYSVVNYEGANNEWQAARPSETLAGKQNRQSHRALSPLFFFPYFLSGSSGTENNRNLFQDPNRFGPPTWG